MEVWPGSPAPLGATYDGAGTNFALYSEVADRVELCLVGDDGAETRVELPERTADVWHGYVPGVRPGQRYGYRVHGPHAPDRGHFCDPRRRLADPYAKAMNGDCLVINPYFDWGNDRPPMVPWHQTIVYELHVKGFTRLHPEVPEAQRGTYAGLAHPAVIDYLKGLGVTAVELMPIHELVHHPRLLARGLKNYWGYSSVGYFAPHHEYSASGPDGPQVQEFKQLVKALHAADIEVILDVVYNHTGEESLEGPTVSFRGIDNAAYYRLTPDRRAYVDYTGCGNSLNMRNPQVIRLIMDSLRYWIEEMHVDGFRFDLASALARELHEVNRLSTFFQIIQQDPVIQRVKLIAEPWDLGEGGYQVGNFPPIWSEWNGKYRDTVRDYWRGQDQTLAELAHRLTGSSDLYADDGRSPYASVNFVTCHDGFTLRDLVSYDHRHNEANLEESGEGHNRSWNCGVEGETDDPQVLALRARQQRNFLVTLFVSQGVPMLLAGDEWGRTQGGNNNPYNQDNAISWFDWGQVDEELLEFARMLVALRRRHPALHRKRWFRGEDIRGTGLSDIGWFKPDGHEMGHEDWQVAYARSLGVFLNGRGIGHNDARGRVILDDSFYLMLNAHSDRMPFVLPVSLREGAWDLVLDTQVARPEPRQIEPGAHVEVVGRSVQLWRRPLPRQTVLGRLVG